MNWITPSEKDAVNPALEKRLRGDANQLSPGVGFESQTKSLRRTRDPLLPRLLSGHVELKTEAA